MVVFGAAGSVPKTSRAFVFVVFGFFCSVCREVRNESIFCVDAARFAALLPLRPVQCLQSGFGSARTCSDCLREAAQSYNKSFSTALGCVLHDCAAAAPADCFASVSYTTLAPSAFGSLRLHSRLTYRRRPPHTLLAFSSDGCDRPRPAPRRGRAHNFYSTQLHLRRPTAHSGRTGQQPTPWPRPQTCPRSRSTSSPRRPSATSPF